MNLKRGFLGYTTLIFTVVNVPFSFAQTSLEKDIQRDGVLNKVYDVVLDEKTEHRKCVKFKPKMGSAYDLCVIGQEAKIEGVNFRFLAGVPKGLKINFGKGRIESVDTLEIMLNYEDKPCAQWVHYVPDENGRFNDIGVPYKVYPSVNKNNKGEITLDKNKECSEELLIKNLD